MAGSHWVAVAGDGLTYTGSPGVEAHLLSVKDFAPREPTEDFKRRYFRPDGSTLDP